MPSFIAYAIGAGLNLLASYLIMLLLVHQLSKSDYGSYGFWVSVFSLLVIVFNFGHKELIFKWVSKAGKHQKIEQAFHSYFWLNVILVTTAAVLYFYSYLTFWIFINFVCLNWLHSMLAWNRAKERYFYDAMALPVQRLVWLGSMYLLVTTGDGLTLPNIFQLASFSTVFVLIISWFSVKAEFLPIWRKPKLDHFSLLLSFVVIELASVFYLKSDVILLKYFDVATFEIADYFFAIQIFEILVLLMMPIGYIYFNGLKAGTQTFFSKASIMFAYVICIHILLNTLGKSIARWLIPDYLEALSLVNLMLFALYPVCLNILLSSYMIYRNKELIFAKICFFALVINLIGNYFYIPNSGIYGAAMVKIFTELFIMLALLVAVRKTLSVNNE